MDKSGSLPMYGKSLRSPANNNRRPSLQIAMVEKIDGVGEVPMISTENLRIQKLIHMIQQVAKDTMDAFPAEDRLKPFSIEFIEKDESEADEVLKQEPKSLKIPKGSEYIGEYFGQKGFRHLEAVPDKIYSIEELYEELLTLDEWEITFYAVVQILMKRWFKHTANYFQDRQVATLVQFLLDETKRKKTLGLLQSFEFGASDPHF